jgi:hypothetical protein
MGGMEALLLAARDPDTVAAAVTMDGVTDLRRRYYEMLSSYRSGDRAQDKLVREVGGTPSQEPARYCERSPISYLANLAHDDVALLIWWSRSDRVAVGQAKVQSGLFFRRLRRLHPEAPLRQVITGLPHNAAFSARVGLPAVIGFLRPGGHWRELSRAR